MSRSTRSRAARGHFAGGLLVFASDGGVVDGAGVLSVVDGASDVVDDELDDVDDERVRVGAVVREVDDRTVDEEVRRTIGPGLAEETWAPGTVFFFGFFVAPGADAVGCAAAGLETTGSTTSAAGPP